MCMCMCTSAVPVACVHARLLPCPRTCSAVRRSPRRRAQVLAFFEGGEEEGAQDVPPRLPVKGYASHGESWSFALALRLASYDLLRSEGDDPILVLDDVFAELDAERSDQLAALVAGAEQVLVTAAVPEDVPQALAGARFLVAGGEVTRDR